MLLARRFSQSQAGVMTWSWVTLLLGELKVQRGAEVEERIRILEIVKYALGGWREGQHIRLEPCRKGKRKWGRGITYEKHELVSRWYSKHVPIGWFYFMLVIRRI
jgi:hypothetical protein